METHDPSQPPIDNNNEHFLVIQKYAEMAPPPSSSSSSSLQPLTRKALFLNPSPAQPIASPSNHRNGSFARLATAKVLFKGWTGPLKRWAEWVHKLGPIYGHIWLKAGILQAILSSCYTVKKDPGAILGVSVFWCAETNTFVFPWAEATVTLEDLIVLGGFSVLGKAVWGSTTGEFGEIEERLVREHRNFNKTVSKKADQSAWMNHFIKGTGDEVEHVAFLALWLSRFVFPSPPVKTVKQHLFGYAIRLSQGSRIALAPAVLAGIYRDLGAVKEYLVSDASPRMQPLVVWSPFNFLQMWIWERFVALRPEKQRVIRDGEPRAARWHDVGKKTDISVIGLVLGSPIDFQWRPYVKNLDSWRRPSYFNNNAELVMRSSNEDEEITAFAQCLMVSELVGLNCIKQYLPHRVAMQFGFDQDIPLAVPRLNATWEEAWDTYDIAAKNFMLCIPSATSTYGVTLRYCTWWKEWMLALADDVNKACIQPAISSVYANQLQESVVTETEVKAIQASQTKRKRCLEDIYTFDLTEKCSDFDGDYCTGQSDIVKKEMISLSSHIENQSYTGINGVKEEMCQHSAVEGQRCPDLDGDCITNQKDNVQQKICEHSHAGKPRCQDSVVDCISKDMPKQLISQESHVESLSKQICEMEQHEVVKEQVSTVAFVETKQSPEPSQLMNEEKSEETNLVDKVDKVEIRSLKSSDRELDFNQLVLMRSGRTLLSQDTRSRMDERAQMRILMKAEESELELEIKRIKEEIKAFWQE